MKRVLVVDDDVMMRQILDKILTRENYRVFEADSAETGWKSICADQPDFVVIDYQLPKMNGVDFLEEMRKKNNLTPAMVISAHGSITCAVKAMKLGAVDFVEKPFDNNYVIDRINKTLEGDPEVLELKTRADVDNNLMSDQLIGKSKIFKEAIKELILVADTNINVIIEGETGSGKELFAKMIHDQSSRYRNDFIPIDCGSIPTHLFESELFGHRRGAFTGATYERKGKFEEAQYGTIFFDEINNLPFDMQAKLLRSIENKSICKVGNNKYEPVDTRILAASNRKIELDVKDGSFRKDLYYRLSEFKINVPPLRERKDDIPLLANYFLGKVNVEMKMNVHGISEKAMEKLMGYRWPGNIRELKNVVSQAVLRANSGVIKEDNIHLCTIDLEDVEAGHSLTKKTEGLEKQAIMDAMNVANGNKTLAAKLLGISRRQLYRKVVKYEIGVP